MLMAGVFEVAIVTAAAVIVGGAIGLWFLSRFVRIVQQGSVGVVKRLSDDGDQLRRLPEREPTLPHPLGKVAPFDVFRDDKT